jgi:hypothetical protein
MTQTIWMRPSGPILPIISISQPIVSQEKNFKANWLVSWPNPLRGSPELGPSDRSSMITAILRTTEIVYLDAKPNNRRLDGTGYCSGMAKSEGCVPGKVRSAHGRTSNQNVGQRSTKRLFDLNHRER